MAQPAREVRRGPASTQARLVGTAHAVYALITRPSLSVASELAELLPSMCSPDGAIELLHALLDMPLRAAALERTARGRDAALAADSHLTAEAITSLSSARAVTNYVLRGEAGLGTINFWSPSTWALLGTFVAEHGPVSLRVEACAAVVPAWLDVFFATVQGSDNVALLETLVPVLLERTAQVRAPVKERATRLALLTPLQLGRVVPSLAMQLYPVPAYERTVAQALLDAVLAAFETAPTLILTLRRALLELLETRRDPANEEFLCTVCWVRGPARWGRKEQARCRAAHAALPWAMHPHVRHLQLIGTYASPQVDPSLTGELLFEFYEVAPCGLAQDAAVVPA